MRGFRLIALSVLALAAAAVLVAAPPQEEAIRRELAFQLEQAPGTAVAGLRRAALERFLDGGRPLLLRPQDGSVAPMQTVTVTRLCYRDAPFLTPYEDALPVTGATAPVRFWLMPGFDRLPAGLAFDTGTGAIRGTPRDTRGLPFSVPLTLIVSDSAGQFLGVLTKLRVIDPTVTNLPDPACE